MGQPHENLVAWQRADDLCVKTYQLTRDRFPREERYQLASQLRRAAYSVAANIVEGYAFPDSGAATGIAETIGLSKEGVVVTCRALVQGKQLPLG
jgi:hypothetical protein